MGWQNVEVPATKIVFQSGQEMRCSHETAFLVNGQSKKSKDLTTGDKVGVNVVQYTTEDGEMLYFINVEDEDDNEKWLRTGWKPPNMSIPEYIEIMAGRYAVSCAAALREGYQPMENGWLDPLFWKSRLIEAFKEEL